MCGITADTLKWYFGYLEYVLDNHNFRVHPGDFIIPLFDWKLGLSAAISQYCSKLKGEAIFSSMCLLGFSQHNYSCNSGNLLDLGFTNFTDVSVNCDIHVLVSPDTYHPPFVTEVQLPIQKSNQLSNISFRKYSSGGNLLLYNTVPPMIGLLSTIRPLLTLLLPESLLQPKQL